MRVLNLTCNSMKHPQQVCNDEVFFGWNLEDSRNGFRQEAYRILVWKQEKLCWDSGRINADQCQYVPYRGSTLEEASEYHWQVEVWDQTGSCAVSEKGVFETGIFTWKSCWIGYDDPTRIKAESETRRKKLFIGDDYCNGTNRFYLPPALYLRRTFCLEEKPQKTRIFFSALGLVMVFINGKRVTQERFLPGLSNYKKTAYLRSYDVTDCISTGENVVSVILADGWYSGYMGLNGRNLYGSRNRFTMQLLDCSGEKADILACSDEQWKAGYGGLIEADIYEGESLDSRMEPYGWHLKGYDDQDWFFVTADRQQPVTLQPRDGAAVVVHGVIPAAQMNWIRPDVCIIAFSEYICGVLRVTVRGETGSSIVIRHSELTGPDGDLYLGGNRSARAQDCFILDGSDEQIFCPEFTFHGFRYASIQLHGNVQLLHVEGVQIGTELKDAAAFRCDNEDINAVFAMAQATEKACFLEVPMDCTARDERLGWGMEGDHFLAASCFYHNQYQFIRKWAENIWLDQKPDGSLEAVAPAVYMDDIDLFTGDLQSYYGIHMVYALYRYYGDLLTVRRYFSQMVSFFDYLDKNSDRNIRYAHGCDWLGIWESTGHTDENHGYGESSPIVIGTAYYSIFCGMMEEMSRALGEKKYAEHYHGKRENILKALHRNLVERDGKLRYRTQGDYLMALACGCLTEEEAGAAMTALAGKMKQNGHIRWYGGTPATPYLLDTLKAYHREDLADGFLTEHAYPSIGYMRDHGSDTFWERWDAIREDGTLHPQAMNAFCHEGMATTGSYLISGLAGINAKEGGFRVIRIAPGLSGQIRYCEASYQSLYGEIAVNWICENDLLTVRYHIPANTAAYVELPCAPGSRLSGDVRDAEDIRYQDGRVHFTTSSGVYQFQTSV